MRALCISGALLAAGCGDSDPPSPVDQVDRAGYEADVTTIAGPRSPGKPHHQEIQDLCADRFASLGFAVERQTYSTGVNVIGTLAGTKLPAERVLVSAHYDAVPN